MQGIIYTIHIYTYNAIYAVEYEYADESHSLLSHFIFYRVLLSCACPAYSSVHLHNTFAASSATVAAAVAAVVALTCIKLQRIVAEHNLCRHTILRTGEEGSTLASLMWLLCATWRMRNVTLIVFICFVD